MKVLLCCFSATGNTAKVARVIGDEFRQLGIEVEERDITPQSERSKKIDQGPDGCLYILEDVSSSARILQGCAAE